MTYTKTQAGSEEIKNRSLKLASQLRTLLLMVDGKKSVAELQSICKALGAPDTGLADLFNKGLIAEASSSGNVASTDADITIVQNPARLAQTPEQAAQIYTRIQQNMNDVVRSVMGLRGVFMTMKIEKCMNLADLKTLYPYFETAAIKAAGKEIGETLCRDIRHALR